MSEPVGGFIDILLSCYVFNYFAADVENDDN